MSKRTSLLLLCFLCRAVTAQTSDPDTPKSRDSQEPAELAIRQSSDPGKRPFLKTFVSDEWTMWSAPFRRSSYPSNTITKYVLPFTLISTALIATDSRSEELLPNTTDQRVWSGRVSQLGASYTLAGFTAATYALGKISGNDHVRETGWLGLEALAHTQLVVFGIKQATNRRRPIVEQTRAGFWNGGDSFPSGHAATSFAVATVFAYEYREHIAVPITAYGVATLISASRLGARKHWMSDIFVGGSTGFLIGRYIYKRHHNPNLPGSSVDHATGTGLVPDVGFGQGGPILTWAW